MTEFRHFNEYGYPGDETLGIPEFEEEQPFSNTYYVELGDDLSQSVHEKRLGNIAEYVALSTASKCRTFFQSARANEFEREHFALRTFGLSVSGVSDVALQDEMMDRLGQKLVNRWINSNPESTFIDAKVTELLSRFEVCPKAISDQIESTTTQETRPKRANKVNDLISIVQSGAADLESSLTGSLDRYFGVPHHRRDSSYSDPELAATLDQFLSNNPVVGSSQLATACINLLDTQGMCLATVEKIVKQVSAQLQGKSDAIRVSNDKTSGELSQIVSAIHRSQNSAEEEENAVPVEDLCNRLFDLRKQEFVNRYTCEFYRVVTNGLEPVPLQTGAVQVQSGNRPRRIQQVSGSRI